MSNPDKHKPLPPEDFFKLLDTSSNSSTDFEDMDDFEKEALKGFAASITSEKAKVLTDELNQAISKRVTDNENKEDKNNKIIWFSAAASLVLIILMSVFFFNQSKQDPENSLALYEAVEENKPIPDLEVNSPIESISERAETSDFKANKALETLKIQSEVRRKKAAEGSNAGLIAESTIALAEKKQAPAEPVAVAKDESKNRNEKDQNDLQKPSVILADRTDAKKKEKGNIEQEKEQLANGYAANQNITSISTTNEEADKLTYKLDEANDSQKTQGLKKSAKEKSANDRNEVNSVGYTKTAPAPSSGSTSGEKSKPYYAGSELAVRDYVLLYLKTKQSLIAVAGTYNILGNVSSEGKLKIISIIQTTKVNCNCENLIIEALNTMTKWNPAIGEGKNVASNVEFTLAF